MCSNDQVSWINKQGLLSQSTQEVTRSYAFVDVQIIGVLPRQVLGYSLLFEWFPNDDEVSRTTAI